MNYTEEHADRTCREAINVARADEFFNPCSAIIDLLSPRESKTLEEEYRPQRKQGREAPVDWMLPNR